MRRMIDPRDARPRVEQLTDGLRGWIEKHAVSGERLPSIRRLAVNQGVGRNMVIEAYERLVALGFLVARPGAGFYVAEGAREVAEREARAGMADVSDEMWQQFQPEGEHLRLGCGWLPTAWRDEEAFGHALRRVTRQSMKGLFDYGTPLGSPELRALVQERLRGLSIRADANQLLTTAGGSQALDAIVRGLLRPGDTVLVESPGYYNLLGLLHLHRVNVIGVPRNEDGPDPECLQALIERHAPRLFFCHSALHNPTGTTLTEAVARRVLALAERHDLWIVEDDIYADFQVTPTPRLAAMDGLRRVFYVGSFSKTLSCSLRVGFVAAPPAWVRTLVDVKMLSTIATSPFAEQVVATLLHNGGYRRLVERLRPRLAWRMDTALALVREGGWETFATPQGGMFLWARHPAFASSRALVATAAKRGIRLSPGDVFLPEASDTSWIRLNVAYVDDARARALLADPR